MSNEPTSIDIAPVAPAAAEKSHRVPLEMILGPIAGIGVALTSGFTRVTHEFYGKTKQEYGLRELVKIRNLGRDHLENIHLDENTDRITKLIDNTKKFEVEGVRENATLSQAFEKIRNQIVTELEGLRTQLSKGAITDNSIWKDALKRVEKTYTDQEKQLLKSKGYKNTGLERLLKGTLQRWDHLGHDTQINIGVGAILSAVVSFGSLFLLGQNFRLRRELSDIHTTLGDQTDQAYAANHPPEIKVTPPVPLVHSKNDQPKTQVQAEALAHQGHAAHALSQEIGA